MSELPDTLEAALASQLTVSPHAAALGMSYVSATREGVVIRLGYRPDLIGDPDTGVIAGGVVTTLLDHACGHSVIVAIGRNALIVTLDLRIDYMRPAEPRLDIYASAHCYKLTHSVGFVRAVAYDRDPADPLASAQAAFIIAGSKA